MPSLIVDLILHFITPVALARVAYPDKWIRLSLIMVSTLVIDLDHLLADPVFEPMRCSIGFHPLHSYSAIAVYMLMLALPGLRVLALGLLIHIGIDGLGCMRLVL